jgi:hypothetical protein
MHSFLHHKNVKYSFLKEDLFYRYFICTKKKKERRKSYKATTHTHGKIENFTK